MRTVSRFAVYSREQNARRTEFISHPLTARILNDLLFIFFV